ncbi:MAG TPA: glycosyltransferase family 4 protein [Chitinophagaceae bacterium]
MQVLFLARSTLYSVYGGDTVQVIYTARYLQLQGIKVEIKLSNEKIDYRRYDLLHIFNATRPADSLAHVKKSGKPYLVSTIYVDFPKDPQGPRPFSADQIEYIKAVGRWIKNGEAVRSYYYLLNGHRKAVGELARGAALLLPNSESEYRRFSAHYKTTYPYRVIYNGIDTNAVNPYDRGINGEHDPRCVVCVGRIERRKNQLNLIKALNNTSFRLKIIGNPSPNQRKYYDICRGTAAANISFERFVPHEQLGAYYQEAKVHVLPSWNETCGLSSLEAAYSGCNIVITDKGDTREYYGDHAFYCDPASPASIYDAIVKAASLPVSGALREKIKNDYNWEKAAVQTLSAYQEVLGSTT